MIKSVLFLIICIVPFVLFSQSIKGVVFDEKTGQPIEGAAIYFDNTTVGVITNFKGEFEIEKNPNVNTPLVISFLGYKKQLISDYSFNELLKIQLKEDLNALDEVLLTSKDSWPRALKLKVFKQQFLGFSDNSSSCKILNEDDIKLQFLEKEKQLVAYANKPLIIENKKLKYKIEYDLQDFEVQYETPDSLKHLIIKSVFYSGTSFFISTDDSKRSEKKRLKVYEGSIIHFMRSMLKGKLKENKFTVLDGNRVVPPENYISIYATEDPLLFQVRIFKTLRVVYDNNLELQSTITPNETYFYVDLNGNHSPVDALTFSGVFGRSRMGDTLPLDYEPDR